MGGGLAVLGLGFALATRETPPPSQQVPPRRYTVDELARSVIEYVAIGESRGKFGAQNRNTDNAGLSYGILQWTQAGGGLGQLLQAMYAADKRTFADTFGPSYASLLAVTAAKARADRLAPVGGVVLWEQPWTDRFTAAGRHPAFQQVQVNQAIHGPWFKEALKVGEILGVRTQRAYVLYFNRTNHQGYRATGIARTLADQYQQNGWPDADQVLKDYAVACAGIYVSRTRLGDTWRQDTTDGLWYYYAGQVNLSKNILDRTSRILADTGLSDEAVVV